MTRLSVGIPVCNEEAVIPELLARLTAVLDTLPGGPHEMVFVDDGSTDRTRELLVRAAQADSRVRLVALARNFGHQAAFSAALDNARGETVVLMDGDLQDEPEIIPQLVKEYEAGADVVFARRASRDAAPLTKFAYVVFYRLIAALSEVRLPLDTGDFSLLSGRVVSVLRALPERQRYLRGLRSWVGFKQVAIDVHRPARRRGKTKFTGWALLKLAVDGICSFSVAPLRLATLAGLIAIVLSVVFSLYALYVRLALGTSPQGFTASLLVTTFLSGVQLFFLGVIGEYLARVYAEAKGRPTYIVAEIVGGGSPDGR